MSNTDKWYYKEGGIRFIKIVVIIFAIGFVFIGLLLSPKDIKSYFQSCGVLLSFLGFLLMLVSSTTWQPSDKGRVKIFGSLHKIDAIFLIGAICVFFGFLFQALGIETSPFFEEGRDKTMVFWMAISAIATAVIAIFAWSNYKLAKEIKESREKHDIDLKKLFRAMVISNLIPANKSYYDALEIFVRHYPHPTEILNEEELRNFRLKNKSKG